jgi:putative DNA primase/helicase
MNVRSASMSSATDRDTRLLRFYDNEGIKVVRLSRRTKRPVDEEWQRHTIPLEDLEEWVKNGGDVGWQCGEVSGWISAADLDWPEARKLAPHFLPETLCGAKGREDPSQYFYRSPELGYKKFTGRDRSEIVALKASNNGAGHQVVVAPSVHRDKGPYLFVGGYNPAAIAVVDSGELRRLLGMLAAAALIARELPPAKEEGGGGRHDLVLALAGYMLRNGEALEDVEKILRGAWWVRNASREALEDVRRSVQDTAGRLARSEPATGGRKLEELMPRMPAKIADFLGWERSDMREQRQSYWLTDLGNAERFVDTYRNVVLWCPARKSWLVWDGTRWVWDDRAAVRKLAHKVARSIYKDAAHEPDEAKQREIAKFARASQNESRIGAMLNEAKPYLAVGMDELDRDPWLINCQNGTLDLRSGKLRPHDSADRITKLVPEEYDPVAPCPRFEQFLKETLVDDAVISFVKRYSGYTLTGITRERLLAMLYGFGKNGKTTLVELLRDVMGDYATNTDTETLLMKRYQGVGNDVAALKGARFVSAAEVEQGRRLAESKVKQLTGRDTVTARFLFGEPFNFTPEFKLWLSTNNKPVIQGTDDAIWDRIRLIPFTQRFDGERQDPKLPEKLRGEMVGVLAWMVEGCLEWQEHGLGEPESVRQATEQYRAEMDTLAAFLDEECVIASDSKVLAERLYQSYAMWCDKSGERKEAKKGFVARLEERGFLRRRETAGVNKGRYIWLGIGFRSGDNPPEDDDDGSPGEPNGSQGSPGEFREDKPNSSGGVGGGEPSEAKKQHSPKQSSRVEKDSDSGFTGFTGFTDEAPRQLAEFLRAPPDWFQAQARKHLEKQSERTLNPLCTAVAADLYSDANRWQEVKPAVSDWLEKASA